MDLKITRVKTMSSYCVGGYSDGYGSAVHRFGWLVTGYQVGIKMGRTISFSAALVQPSLH